MDAYTIARLIKAIYSYQDSEVLFLYIGDKHKHRIDKYLSTIYTAEKIIDIQRGGPSNESKCVHLTPDDKIKIISELRLFPPTHCHIKK